MLGERRLKMESFPKKDCGSVGFTQAAKVYER